MSAVIRHLMKRFPQFETIIDELISTNTSFDELCREYGELNEHLENLDSRVDPVDADKAENMRRRRAALEEEMLLIMEANARV